MSQQSGSDDMTQLTLQDNAVPSRIYTGNLSSGRTYRTNRKNGLPTLTFVDRVYVANSSINIPASTPYLFWSVMQTAGTDGYLWALGDSYQVRFNYGGANGAMLIYSGGFAQSVNLAPGESTAWAIYMSHRNASNQVRHYYNGLPKFGTPPTLATELTLLAFLDSSVTSNFNTELAEAGILSSDPSTAQINQLGNYLAAKWAIAWTNIS
ncbi:MAG TPA: hypothetical protein V6C84_25850 [Coleofasciculaceae cyanobacterium]|jgi:hypothetical protein